MNTAGIPTTVEELRTQWPVLHDLDKAASVNKIGMSIRAIAKELGLCTESHLRYLRSAAKAPIPDRILARHGKISTRELAKRSKAATKADAEKTRAKEKESRAKDAKKWSTKICRWLQELGLAWEHQVQILDLTRRELDSAERIGILPRPAAAAKSVPLDEIIKRTCPADSRWSSKDQRWEGSLDIYLFVEWLGLWTLAAIQDRIIQDAALGDASLRTRQMEIIASREA